MSQKFKLWLRLPVAVQHIDGLSTDGAYRAIRNGTFPFRTEIIAGRIYVSARDLGLMPENDTKQEAQEGQSLATATPACASGD